MRYGHEQGRYQTRWSGTPNGVPNLERPPQAAMPDRGAHVRCAGPANGPGRGTRPRRVILPVEHLSIPLLFHTQRLFVLRLPVCGGLPYFREMADLARECVAAVLAAFEQGSRPGAGRDVRDVRRRQQRRDSRERPTRAHGRPRFERSLTMSRSLSPIRRRRPDQTAARIGRRGRSADESVDKRSRSPIRRQRQQLKLMREQMHPEDSAPAHGLS